MLFARINTLTFEEGTPDSKISLGVDWTMPIGGANFGVNLKGTRYGEVIEPGVPTHGGNQRRCSRTRATCTSQPDWLVDLALNAKFMDDKLGFTLGADNLFDQYPDRVPNARAADAARGVVNLNAHERAGVFALFALWLQRALRVSPAWLQLVGLRRAGAATTAAPI